MKRSRSLSLVLMGSLMFGAQGCSENNQEESFTAFTSLSECASSGIFSEAECRQFATDALAQNPRFASQADCEKEFGEGQCASPEAPVSANGTAAVAGGTQVEQRSGSMWMPMMMGFMAGRMMSGGAYSQGSQPLYRDTRAPAGERSFRTATGDTVKPAAGGRVTNPPAKVRQSMAHTAKPVMNRAGGMKSSGGFSGGSNFGGASS